MEFPVSADSINALPAANPVFGPEVFKFYLGAALIDMRGEGPLHNPHWAAASLYNMTFPASCRRIWSD